MCGPARFHDDLGPRGQPVEESLEWPARQSLPFDDPPLTIREGHFENVLCQINRHRRSIHLGLLLVCGFGDHVHGSYDGFEEMGFTLLGTIVLTPILPVFISRAKLRRSREAPSN